MNSTTSDKHLLLSRDREFRYETNRERTVGVAACSEQV
jgi:hypothetical protein